MEVKSTSVGADGTMFWFANQTLHRDDGPAVITPSGDKTWYRNGILHRDDGPAMEFSVGKFWYCDGELHREDGPAIEYADGTKEWWLNGNQIDPLVHFLQRNKEFA